MSEERPVFLQDIHAFRGIAIINIVAVHVFDLYLFNSGQIVPLSDSAESLLNASEVLFHDSTIYFALISGLLFSKVLVDRGWQRFFQSKLTNVILPFSFMTLVFSLIWYDESPCVDQSPCIGDSLIVTFEGLVPFVERYVSNLLHGSAVGPYWYIPVLACLFALTPALQSLAKKVPVSLLIIALLPLICSRSGTSVSLRSVIYFAGVYSMGMYVGMNYERSLSRLKEGIWMLASIAFVTSVILWVFYEQGYNKFVWPVSLRESLFYVQKLSLAGLFLVFLNRWKTRMPEVLQQLATYAFSIYFLHFFILIPLIGISLRLRPPPVSTVEVILMGTAILLAVLGISMLIAMGFRAVLGRRSRMFTGA